MATGVMSMTGTAEPEIARHEVEIVLPVRAPFDWARSLDFLAQFPATRGEQVLEDGALVKAWRMNGRSVVTRIGTAEGGLRVTIASSRPVDAVLRDVVADRVSFWLSLDDDLTPLVRGAEHDHAFAVVEGALHGYHQVKFPTPVEHVVWAVLSQRTPMAVARSAKQELLALNPPVLAFGHELRPFPSLGELIALSEEELAGRVRNVRKASYLYRSLRILAEVDEEFLRTAPADEVERFLLTMPGIGPWSANFVLIRGLGRMDRVPDDDELVRSYVAVYGGSPTPGEIRDRASRYEPGQGYWAHYLRAGGHAAGPAVTR